MQEPIGNNIPIAISERVKRNIAPHTFWIIGFPWMRKLLSAMAGTASRKAISASS